MSKQIPSYLKLHCEEPPEAPPRLQETDLEEFCQAFTQATGWPLRFVENPPLSQDLSLMWSAPVTPGVGTALGHLRLDFNNAHYKNSRKTSTTQVKAEAAQRLAAWGSSFFGQLADTRLALWQREAELAAGVPLSQRPDEKQHLASRLAAVVQGGAEAVDCQAAALYLLDEATTELKMRSYWGLPAERLLEPPRALKQSMADLEALSGHAVVLEDSNLMAPWNVPEKFASAVCVPVSSPTVPLGTLWMFCDRPRSFSDIQMNVVEIIAGRLSADLEREMLLHEATQHVELARELDSAGQLQRNQLPAVAPLSDTWSIAGWTSQAGKVGGAFHDWFHLANDSLAIVAGNSRGQGVEAALSAQMLRTSVSVHGQSAQTPDQLLAQVNHTLWTGSAGGQFAWLFYAVLDSGTHTLEYSFSGEPSLLLLHRDRWDSLLDPALPLGLEPETTFSRSRLSLEPGQVLVIFNRSMRETTNPHDLQLGEATVAEALTGHLDLPAHELLVKVRQSLESHAADRTKDDLAVLVVKRR